jgi:hypothetical protein
MLKYYVLACAKNHSAGRHIVKKKDNYVTT